MNQRLTFRPDLDECVLEERCLLAIANLGTIVPTTSGLVLLTPFPGANSSGAGSLGSSGPSSGAAGGVSGAPIPSGFFVTGLGGISTMRPGNLTGIASLGGGAALTSGVGLTIQIGSGANSAQTYNGAPATVSLTTVGDATVQSTLNTIGTVSASSLSSPTMASSQDYHYVAPPPPPPASSTTIPGPSASYSVGTGIANPYAPSIQAGGISSGPFTVGRGVASPLPGSLNTGSSLIPRMN